MLADSVGFDTCPLLRVLRVCIYLVPYLPESLECSQALTFNASILKLITNIHLISIIFFWTFLEWFSSYGYVTCWLGKCKVAVGNWVELADGGSVTNRVTISSFLHLQKNSLFMILHKNPWWLKLSQKLGSYTWLLFCLCHNLLYIAGWSLPLPSPWTESCKAYLDWTYKNIFCFSLSNCWPNDSCLV